MCASCLNIDLIRALAKWDHSQKDIKRYVEKPETVDSSEPQSI